MLLMCIGLVEVSLAELLAVAELRQNNDGIHRNAARQEKAEVVFCVKLNV